MEKDESPLEKIALIVDRDKQLNIEVFHKAKLLLRIYRDHITAHMFRHTYASMLYEAGVDIKSAQRFLGHADIERYTPTLPNSKKMRP